MKDWKIEDLNDNLLTIFQKASNIAEEACVFFEKSHKKLSIEGGFELFLFNLFYSWKYLQEKNLVPTTADSAKMFIVAGFMKIEKINKDIEVGNFNNLYKDWFIHHQEELKDLIKNSHEQKMYVPYYFYKLVDKEVILDDDLFNPIELADKYINLINHLKIKFDQTF